MTVDIAAVVVPLICEEIAEAPSEIRFLQAMVAVGKQLADAIVYASLDSEPDVSVLTPSDQLWKLMLSTSEVKWTQRILH